MLKVSIVTVSFNQAKFLDSAIRSVLNQAYRNTEYIIVDPGSADGSREIIQQYGDRITKIFEKDRGAADGLNKGFAAASGDIFGYINADDVLLPGVIDEMVRVFEQNRDIDVVIGNGYVINAQGRALRRVYSTPFDLRGYAMGSVLTLQQSTFFRSSAFRKIAGFNADNRTCWDGELLVDMALAGSTFKHVSRFWSAFRIHENSITGSGRLNDRYVQDQARLIEKILGRSPTRQYVIRTVTSRIKKWARQPYIPLCRIMDEVNPPRLVIS